MGRGLLHLTVLSAKDLPKQERFGKQQYYVEIQLGSSISRTRTSKNGAQNTIWNETIFCQLGNEQHIQFRVFLERMLVKNIEVGAATLPLDQVLLIGTDDAVLPLTYKGQQRGSLSVSLELRSTTGAATSRGSSGSSLASPLSSASLANSQSGSMGGSFTGPPGLKQSSMPIMLMQQPSLALYREQLLQQSAVLAQQQQQRQQQQQKQQQQQQRVLARISPGAGSSSSGHRSVDPLSSRKPSSAPKRTAVDLFADKSSLHASLDAHDLLGAFGAYDSTCSDYMYDSNYASVPAHAGQPVDFKRVQALIDAVYGTGVTPGPGLEGSGKGLAHSGAHTSAMASAAMRADAVSASCTGQFPATAAGSGGCGASVAQTVSITSRATSSQGSGAVGNQGAAAAGGTSQEPGEGTYNPFGAAASQAAAAAAGACTFSSSTQPHTTAPGAADSSSKVTAAGGQSQPRTATDSAAAAGTDAAAAPRPGSVTGGEGGMHDGFGAASVQAAAAAFAASGGALLLQASTGSSEEDVSDNGDVNAFLAGLAAPGTSAAPAADGSGMPDPFGAFGGMQAALAAAAAAMHGADMPDPFGAGRMHAAEAAGAAPLRGDMPNPFGAKSSAAAAAAAAAAAGCAGVASTAIPESAELSMRPEQLAQTTTGGVRPLRRSVGASLQTVIEVSESPSTSSARLDVVGSLAASVPTAQCGSRRVSQDAATSSRSASQERQLQEQVSMLARQLQEKDLLIQQLQEQLRQSQQQL